ncbi:UNVERIFIED_CONTAM: hypothetical protein Slati_4516100 [Sesamum latifolium]|uniref:Reverse transcriptase domain-containing protein n=1 Tax=Sesamum latifolium TaxID=2727402 RepID=A0AAW2SSQ5_9LAMI
MLCFADDLLLFCEAEAGSVTVIYQALERFALLSGLQVNSQKSQVILSKSADSVKPLLLDILGFQERELPVKYLGVPLLSTRLSITNCRSLILKLDKKIQGWGQFQLSFAGRLQLINDAMGLAKVSWVQLCRPFEEGGLGIPDIAAMNRALMCKHLCELVVNPLLFGHNGLHTIDLGTSHSGQ